MFRIERFIGQFSEKTIALSVYDLETGREFNLRADVSLHPASTIKVPIMLAVFQQAEAGLFSLDDRIAIRNEFTSIADGSSFALDIADDSDQSLYHRIGDTEALGELTRLMIVRSSNLATNLLLDRIGVKPVNELMRKLGVKDVSVLRGVEDKAAYRAGLNNSATARGLTRLMRLLAEGTVVSERASLEMIQIMLGQEFNESIPASLPAPVHVAHKTGWTGEYYHDTGLVFPEKRKPYAISIMTHGFPEYDETRAHACMAEISRLVYQAILSSAQ